MIIYGIEFSMLRLIWKLVNWSLSLLLRLLLSLLLKRKSDCCYHFINNGVLLNIHKEYVYFVWAEIPNYE